MSKIKTKELGVGATIVILVMSFGAFAMTAAIVSKNHFSFLTPSTLANDDEESNDSENSGDTNQNDNEDNNTNDNKSKSQEEAKKQAERERESAKKQAEREREAEKRRFEQLDKNSQSAELENEDDSNNNNDNENEADTKDNENEGQGNENGMYKDRGKTLEKLQEKIAEAEKQILEKQAEGVDVTAALARLAFAKSSISQINSLFDTNDLEAAKMLAKQIRKNSHFTEKDMEYAGKTGEILAKIEKRFGQVEEKISSLQSLGGDVSSFQARLSSLKNDFSVLKTSIETTPGTITYETIKTFEKQTQRLKSLIESEIFARGGTDDGDLVKDHEEGSDNLSEDLNDVADIEDGDSNNVSEKVRKIASEHKAQTQQVEQSLENIKDRAVFTRVLLGPDSNALETLGGQVTAMQNRSATISSLANQMTDYDIKQILLDQAEALRNEALKLQSYIAAENNQFSFFGKLISFFR
jgi:hypothetical protein